MRGAGFLIQIVRLPFRVWIMLVYTVLRNTTDRQCISPLHPLVDTRIENMSLHVYKYSRSRYVMSNTILMKTLAINPIF